MCALERIDSQAFAEVPSLTVYYGPDSYMGVNIAELFLQMAMTSDEEINKIHPRHNRASIRSLLPRLQYFQVIKLMLDKLKLRKNPTLEGRGWNSFKGWLQIYNYC
ncbi:hypothetical protein Droror1_Dr00023386 [Drosera rotundifolia]